MKEIRLIQNSKNNLSENYNVGEEYQKFEFQEIFDCLTKYDFNERLSVHDLITTSKQRFKKLYSFI